ncbi:MAG TPA: mandelate racemase/muconate lactonizing enzyme family protein, partial [Vicinamibacteria bacterium]
MQTSRRRFVEAGLLGGWASAGPSSASLDSPRTAARGNPRYTTLDGILHQPVLRRELFRAPVVIESLELLRHEDSFLCRVRSRDGATGLSVGHSGLKVLYPLFVHNLQPFFVGKDARDLDLLLEKVFVYSFNFRYGGISIGTPLATIEHAILDLLGRVAGRSFAELVGEVRHPEV